MFIDCKMLYIKPMVEEMQLEWRYSICRRKFFELRSCLFLRAALVPFPSSCARSTEQGDARAIWRPREMRAAARRCKGRAAISPARLLVLCRQRSCRKIVWRRECKKGVADLKNGGMYLLYMSVITGVTAGRGNVRGCFRTSR